MKPILKWTGGKRSELTIIKEYMPEKFNRYIEPFVGGGAVFFNLENKLNIVNDFNQELITFYKIINDFEYFSKFEYIINRFIEQRNFINSLYDINTIDIEGVFNTIDSKYLNIFKNYLNREFNSKDKLIKSVSNNLEIKRTVLHSALYYMYRDLYNRKNIISSLDVEHISYWFIMRELAYSGMFRFSYNGLFNVPYGGKSYNKKNFSKKLNLIKKIKNNHFYQNTIFENFDFNMFFDKNDYFKEDDFIFLDPPYDTEFSKYNKDCDFNKNDQIRLRDCLLKTKAKIMLVIKNTPYIFDLYKNCFNIIEFDKLYSVNIKNRNSRQVKHLMITNY